MPATAAASPRGRPSITSARASSRRTCALSGHLLDSARSSPLVWSVRVRPSAAPIQYLRHPDSHIRTANRNDRDLKTPESRSPSRLGITHVVCFGATYVITDLTSVVK